MTRKNSFDMLISESHDQYTLKEGEIVYNREVNLVQNVYVVNYEHKWIHFNVSDLTLEPVLLKYEWGAHCLQLPDSFHLWAMN